MKSTGATFLLLLAISSVYSLKTKLSVIDDDDKLENIKQYGALHIPDLQQTIHALVENIKKSQAKTDVPFSIVPLEWALMKGLFASEVRMNFVGDPDMTMARDLLSCPDNNMFVTTWVLEVLLEAWELGTVTNLDTDTVQMAINALSKFHDLNVPQEMPDLMFWSQVNMNGTWIAWPENLEQVIVHSDQFLAELEKVLLALGLDSVWEKIQQSTEEFMSMASAFKIPADFDDSGCFLALGTYLYHARDQFPQAYDTWAQTVPVPENLAAKVKQYAYRPLSDDSNINVVDPRTYYFLHEFLANNTDSDLAFITTWIMNLDENRKMYYEGIAMPFNVNNVDLSVTANAIYGLLRHLIMVNPDSAWFDAGLQSVIYHSAKLIEWSVTSGRITERHDLALLYYPPIYDFYWFVSRTLFLLDNNLQQADPAIQPFLKQIQDIFANTMRNAGTAQLLNMSNLEKSFLQDYYHWDDFLGMNDINILGKPAPHYDDRLFSTSVAVNALLDTWTETIPSCVRQWRSDTPTQVIKTVVGAVSWLHTYIMDPLGYKKFNCFFSGSVKSGEQLPFFFPANYEQYLNGSTLPPNAGPQYISADLVMGIQGIIPESQYEAMVNQPQFGVPVPVNFTGFNQEAFPFWSSEPLTEATTVLALSKFLRLSECS